MKEVARVYTKRAVSFLGGLVAASLLAACGTAAPAHKTAASSSASTGAAAKTISVAPLAAKASELCAKPPTNPKLDLRLDTPGSPAVNPAEAALQAINYGAAGDDGPFTLTTVDNTTVIQPVAGIPTGPPYGELYFWTGGAVPASVQNVEVCLEVYDAIAGQQISAQFSGTNTAAPVGGAYAAAPQAYITSGTKQWYTLSFNFSGIAFQAGASGSGKENASADFRINLQPPFNSGAVYFKRIWLVTQNVPTQASLASTPAGAAIAGSATSGTSASASTS